MRPSSLLCLLPSLLLSAGAANAAPLPPLIEPAFTFMGPQPGGQTGCDYVTADLDGDGHLDYVFGSRMDDVGDLNAAGRVYIVYGPVEDGDGALDLAQADAILEGDALDSLAGTSVGITPDINGDGLPEVLVAHTPGGSGNPEVAVFFSPLLGRRSLGDADLRIRGDGAQVRGLSSQLASAGDVNGDGVEDLILGATETRDEAGAVTGAAGYILLAPLTGDALLPQDAYATFPTPDVATLRAAGDLNGDGASDLVLGSPKTGPLERGAVYIFNGPIAPGVHAPETADARILPDRGHLDCYLAPPWGVGCDPVGHGLGRRLSALGDVDGDGYGDLFIGDVSLEVRAGVRPSPAHFFTASYLFRGPIEGTRPLASADLVFQSEGPAQHLGADAVAFDANGDGHRDLLLTDPGFNPELNAVGALFLYLGPLSPGRYLWQDADHRRMSTLELGVIDSARPLPDRDGDGLPELLLQAYHYTSYWSAFPGRMYIEESGSFLE